MNDPYSALSARERQVMDAIYQLGVATAADVRTRIPDPPTDATVRSTLRVLEDKGWLTHERVEGRYVYRPTEARGKVRHDLLDHLVSTFFNGSPTDVVAALLESPTTLDETERRRIRELLDQLESGNKKQ